MSACILAFSAWVSFGNAAFAQRVGASIDAGALNVRYADSTSTNAIAVTPSLWSESDFTTLGLNGTLSQFVQGGWSVQGDADASQFTHRLGPLLGEIEGAAGGSSRNDGSRTGQLLGTARAHLSSIDKGVWIGAGAGGAWDGSAWRTVRQGEAAAWARFGYATAFASATPVIVADSIKYTDAQGSISFNLPIVEIEGSGGFRNGSNLPVAGGTSKSWGSASVTAWIASRIAIVASAGTYPVDFTQGFPGGRFASLSLRVGMRRLLPPSTSSRELHDLGSISGERARTETSFELKAAGGISRELRFRDESANTVEVTGDFTDWKPVSLERSSGGWWIRSFPIPAGIREMNIRVNGGPWKVPPGIPEKSDEFGGKVGILVVR